MLGWTVLSELKRDPSRHIPVQIVTLDEDRQPGLARGAFAFVSKPTSPQDLHTALTRIKDSRTAPQALAGRGRQCAEQLSIAQLLGHDDVDIALADTGARALALLRGSLGLYCARLRLPDMSGFEVWRACGTRRRCTTAGSRVHGRELSLEEDARLHTMARSVVVKGVESPERLLDETALFLHRTVSALPPAKREMLERLHSSNEDLVGRTSSWVDDDARNIFALSSVLERRSMKVLAATTATKRSP